MERKSLWRIYIPKSSNEGKEFGKEHHRKWDAFVRKIAGGLTVHRSALGEWMHNGEVFVERMIPVEVICSEEEINLIVAFTLDHYAQQAVNIVRLSDDVRIMKK